jgi:hypothetical protein
MTSSRNVAKVEPGLKTRMLRLITPKNALVFLAGLGCFILALYGNDRWASSFGTIAVLALIFG